MSFWIGVAARNLRRNGRRTLLTGLAVVMGTALLTLGLSWIGGVLGGMLSGFTALGGEVRVMQPGFARREAVFPLYENIAPVGPVLEAIEGAGEGVRAWPVIRMPVTATVHDELGEDFVLLVGAPRAYFQDVLGLEVLEGAPLSGEDAHEALLGRIAARDLGARVGDELIVLGQTQDGSISSLKFRVQGIVQAGNAVAEKQVFIPLERARWLADIPDGAVEVLVYGDSVYGAGALARRLEALPALEGLEVQPWTERSTFRSMFVLLRGVFGTLSVIILAVTTLVVLNTMIMAVMERTAEIGVMRAMGMTAPGVVALFVTEAFVLGVASSALGVALGSLPAWWMERHGVTFGDDLLGKVSLPVSATLYADLNWAFAGLAFVLGIGTAVVGAALPALRAASIQPVAAMRRRK